MKTTISKSVLVGASILTAAIAVQAGALQRTEVMKDPIMVLHLDCDAFRETGLGKFVLEQMEKPDAKKQVAAFQTIFNIDPRKELHGLTAYGATENREDGVLLVHADFDPAHLTTLAEGAKEHDSAKHGKYTIHSWTDDKRSKDAGDSTRTFAAIRDKVIIFGQKEKRVADALDVLEGAKPNLTASQQYAGLRAPAAGNFFQAGATRIVGGKSDPSAVILKQAKFYDFAIGEAEQKAVATLSLTAGSTDVAKQIESVGQGLVGLLALQSQNPDAVKLAQALTIKQDGLSVVAKISMAVNDVVDFIKTKMNK